MQQFIGLKVPNGYEVHIVDLPIDMISEYVFDMDSKAEHLRGGLAITPMIRYFLDVSLEVQVNEWSDVLFSDFNYSPYISSIEHTNYKVFLKVSDYKLHIFLHYDDSTATI